MTAVQEEGRRGLRLIVLLRPTRAIIAMTPWTERSDREGSTTISGNVRCGSKWRSSFRQRAAVGNRSTIP